MSLSIGRIVRESLLDFNEARSHFLPKQHLQLQNIDNLKENENTKGQMKSLDWTKYKCVSALKIKDRYQIKINSYRSFNVLRQKYNYFILILLTVFTRL